MTVHLLALYGSAMLTAILFVGIVAGLEDLTK